MNQIVISLSISFWIRNFFFLNWCFLLNSADDIFDMDPELVMHLGQNWNIFPKTRKVSGDLEGPAPGSKVHTSSPTHFAMRQSDSISRRYSDTTNEPSSQPENSEQEVIFDPLHPKSYARTRVPVRALQRGAPSIAAGEDEDGGREVQERVFQNTLVNYFYKMEN